MYKVLEKRKFNVNFLNKNRMDETILRFLFLFIDEIVKSWCLTSCNREKSYVVPVYNTTTEQVDGFYFVTEAADGTKNSFYIEACHPSAAGLSTIKEDKAEITTKYILIQEYSDGSKDTTHAECCTRAYHDFSQTKVEEIPANQDSEKRIKWDYHFENGYSK